MASKEVTCFLHFAETGGGEPEPFQVLLEIARLHHDEAVGVRIRKRREQDRVDHAEDRRVRADAEREREHGDESEPGDLRSWRKA